MSAIHTPPVSHHAARSEYVLYVGTYDQGIYAFRFHVATGKLEALGLKGELKNPSFVVADPKQQHLYAVSELDGDAEGMVGAFSIDRNSGELKRLNTEGSAGAAPCHLAVDHSGRVALVANYTSGAVSAFPIGHDGTLGARSAVMKAEGASVNVERQKGPHAHQVVISPDNKFVYAPDLGLDQIRIYSLDAGKGTLREDAPLKVEAGLGPRHMVLSPGGHFAYILSELKTKVTIYKRLNGTKFELVESMNSLPEGEPVVGGAEILLDHAGTFLYASNRDVTNKSVGSISVFAVDGASGKLRRLQNIETAGRMPRGVELDPSGRFLLVGDQKANVIQLFQIGTDGKLTKTDATYETPSPVSFAFVPSETPH